MFYIAIPELSFAQGRMEGIYAASWLFFGLLVFAGNLAAYLYSPRKSRISGRTITGPGKKKKARLFAG